MINFIFFYYPIFVIISMVIQMENILIIGAGPAGLTAAIVAARNGKKVTITERNSKCGKKLLLTGNGKCNFWNKEQNITHYHSSSPLIKNFITEKVQNSVLSFFDSLGIIYKEKNNYYYPFTNQALTIYNALLLECQKLGIKIINDITVDKIIKEDCFIINPEKENIKAKTIIIAAGSKAMSKTGSDGLGYTLAKSLGHTIIKPLPSLVQLKGEESYFKNWSGIRSHVLASLYIDNTLIKKEEGEVQLTNYGLSGICIFNLSGLAAKALDKNKKVEISLNFMSFTQNYKDFLKDLNKKSSNKTINELLEGFLNYKLIDIILKKANIKRNLKLNTLSEIELNKLIENLTNFKIKITSTNTLEHAQVCSGGIPLEEINNETLESLKVKNLYFVGEIIDIDGDCGGYNLGWAWMSGIVAGKNVK